MKDMDGLNMAVMNNLKAHGYERVGLVSEEIELNHRMAERLRCANEREPPLLLGQNLDRDEG